jgi:hypothetical protein
MAGFQRNVHAMPAPAVPGDFASTNPRRNVSGGVNALVAGTNGVTVGRFAWKDGGDGTTARNAGPGKPSGLVARVFGEALITTYMGETSNIIPQGMPVTVFNEGDFWVRVSGDAPAQIGQKVFADNANGQCYFYDAGFIDVSTTATGHIDPGTSSFTGSIADNVLTVTHVTSGGVYVGTRIHDPGNVLFNPTIIKRQIDGTDAGVGTYEVSVPSDFPSGTINGAYGILTVTVAGTGAFGVGDAVGGTGVNDGTYVSDVGTGPDAGKFIVRPSQTVASGALTGTGSTETDFFAATSGAVGDVVIITSASPG